MFPNTITTSTSTASNIIYSIRPNPDIVTTSTSTASDSIYYTSTRSNPNLYSLPATTDAYETHFSYVATKEDIDEINGILFDICDILADLYEKKRLGRDGNLSAIREFLDSIKVTEG